MPVTCSSRKVGAKKKNGRASIIKCLSDMKTADTARSSKGRIAEL